MKKNLIALVSGLIFGLGLAVSQMTNPEKVLAFLDIFGDWNPGLAFVMVGALTVTAVSFKWIFKQPKPVLAEKFYISPKNWIDKPLVMGAAIFGVGWGLTGYCPGPAIANIGTSSVEAIVMVLSIYAGFYCQSRMYIN